VGWIYLAPDRVRWLAVVNRVMNLRFSSRRISWPVEGLSASEIRLFSMEEYQEVQNPNVFSCIGIKEYRPRSFVVRFLFFKMKE
jgi:hypothetical protein